MKKLISFLLAGAFLSACSGAGAPSGSTLPGTPNAVRPNGHRMGHLVLKIKIPHKKVAHRGDARAHYISPSTKSLTLVTTGPTVLDETVNLTPTSTGCTSTIATTYCVLDLTLAPGSYTGTIATFDGLNGAGKELSTAQAVPFTVTVGTLNTINMTLSGIPTQLLVVPASSTAQSNAQGGIDLFGTVTSKLMVEALDADDNIILGAGSPSFAVAKTAGALAITLGQPNGAAGNVFTVAPPLAYSASTATIQITASFGSQPTDGCAQAGAVCTALVVVDMQEVFAVATTSSVSLFVFGQTSPFSTISGLDNVKAIAADSAGNLYVSTCGTNCGAAAGAPPDSVNIYAPPYNGTPTVMSTASSIFRPQAIAFDGTGNMYVAVCNQVCGTPQQDAVLKFSPPFTATSTPSVDYNNGVVSPDALALDTSNDLFVADNGATGPVQEYASGAISGAAPTNTVTSGVTFPNAITLDAANNLYVSNGTGSTCGAGNTQTVSYYAAGSYTVMNGSFPTTHVNCPISLAFDTVNNRLFIGNSNSGSVNAISEFKNPINSSGSFQLSIANSVNDPVAMLLDSSHNLYVANNVANSATIYNRSAGYGLQSTISGVTGPIGLAIVP